LNCPACGAPNDTAGEHCFSCGKTLFALTEGTIVAGRYELRQLLGKGGMGIVYRAYDRALEEEVALKVLRPDVASMADITRRFISEIKLARRVRHRNVCGIHEYGQDGPIHFIAMELVAGEDLKRQLQAHGPLPPAEAWDVAIQIAEGLDAIHHADVVHRDLKAHNIMRDTRGVVRVMDFGIAKALGMASGGATVTGQIIGTPEYMSPEQARGDQIDFRSDIYALGIVVYEIFTGSVPFRGETPIATLFKHIQDPPLIEGRQGIPEHLVPILKRALAKDPKDRFESASAMATALRHGYEDEMAQGTQATAVFSVDTVVEAAGHDTHVPSPTQVPPPRRTTTAAHRPPLPRPAAARPRRTGAVVMGGLLAAIVVGAMIAVLRARATPAPPEPSPRAAVLAPPIVSAPATQSTPTPSVAPSPAAPSPVPARAPLTAPVVLPTMPPAPRPSPAPSRPSPSPVARVERAPAPSPVPPPASSTTAAGQGTVRIRVLPWADVEVDGELKGTTPLRPLTLSAGAHVLRFRHPEFLPLIKRITVRADETLTVEVDLARDAFPR
jgi:eukaryotic-like serine/threonine-protein kinase